MGVADRVSRAARLRSGLACRGRTFLRSPHPKGCFAGERMEEGSPSWDLPRHHFQSSGYSQR